MITPRIKTPFFLFISAAPVVSPIVFSSNLEEGHRGSAVCTVTSGDSPMDITWLKDGVPLREQMTTTSSSAKRGSSYLQQQNSFASSSDRLDHIQIVQIANFMSTLTIANISRMHAGLYTCVAASPVSTTHVSARLSVRAAPQWRLKPADRLAVAGDSLTLDCQTSGQPPPVTRWKFLAQRSAGGGGDSSYHGGGQMNSEPNPILSSQQVHVLENGSLYLRAVEPKHAGLYICDATNGVGSRAGPVEARAHLAVASLPKVVVQNTLGAGGGGSGSGSNIGGVSGVFRSGLLGGGSSSGSSSSGLIVERLVLRKGAQTQLLCSALGADMPMTAQWLRSNHLGGSFQVSQQTFTFCCHF